MTALSVVQKVAGLVRLSSPAAVFGSTDADAIVLRNLLLEAVDYVREDGNWQALATQATITGDGSTVAFDLPSDYDFIPRENKLWSSAFASSLRQVHSLDEWLDAEVRDFSYVYNAWIIYGDQIHTRPALATGVTAKYFYQSKNAVIAADTSTKEAPTADTDTFKISERLLVLCMVWMYRRDNTQPYDTHLEDYERARSKILTRDAGPMMLKVGRPKLPRDVSIAYPWNIVP